MNPEKIGKFICELRKEKNLSQYQLADMIPISRQGVSKWERGVTTPDTQTLIQLSEMFDVTIDELLRGERSDDNSIEKLEETTLSILDQSNKKTKTIKRITITSISIITILLLAFLSYYFLNSYNSMEIYTVGGKNDNYMIKSGIFVVTKEKYYLKLGNIKNKIDAEISNIKLYYKNDNKSIVLIEDKEVDNITIIESYGYGEKLTRRDAVNLKDNLYVEITYNENETDTIKLRCIRDYKNSSLFFLNQKKVGEKEVPGNTKNEIVENTKIEESKPQEEKKEEVKQVTTKTEESKPTINEITENQKEEAKAEQEIPKEANTEEQSQIPTEEHDPATVEEGIITEQVINKIKEICTYADDTYTCEYNEGVMIMYYESTNKIGYYKNYSLIGRYDIVKSKTICKIENCENEIDNIIKEYLFK